MLSWALSGFRMGKNRAPENCQAEHGPAAAHHGLDPT